MARTRLTKKMDQVVKQQAVSMTDLIDRYGDIDAQLKELEKEKKELREKLQELGIGEHKGNRYKLTISEYQSIVLNPIKVAKKIGSKAFLQIVTVPVEKARIFLSEHDLEECVKERKVSTRMSVKRVGK